MCSPSSTLSRPTTLPTDEPTAAPTGSPTLMPTSAPTPDIATGELSFNSTVTLILPTTAFTTTTTTTTSSSVNTTTITNGTSTNSTEASTTTTTTELKLDEETEKTIKGAFVRVIAQSLNIDHENIEILRVYVTSDSEGKGGSSSSNSDKGKMVVIRADTTGVAELHVDFAIHIDIMASEVRTSGTVESNYTASYFDSLTNGLDEVVTHGNLTDGLMSDTALANTTIAAILQNVTVDTSSWEAPESFAFERNPAAITPQPTAAPAVDLFSFEGLEQELERTPTAVVAGAGAGAVIVLACVCTICLCRRRRLPSQKTRVMPVDSSTGQG